MKMIKVAIVDDRDIIRDLLALMLKLNKNIEIVGEANDGNQAIQLVGKQAIDIIIMDINMPNMNGVEATKKIRAKNPNIKILCNSFFVDARHVKMMIDAGASGYIKKGEPLEAYVDAIHTINNHGVYLSDEIDEEIYDEIFKSLKFNISKKKGMQLASASILNKEVPFYQLN